MSLNLIQSRYFVSQGKGIFDFYSDVLESFSVLDLQ